MTDNKNKSFKFSLYKTKIIKHINIVKIYYSVEKKIIVIKGNKARKK